MLELRQMTGMKQEELAAMLGISRTAIAMHESSGRSLPRDAFFYHTSLWVEMTKPENQDGSESAGPSDSSLEQWKKELKRLIKQNRYTAEQLQRKITAYQEKESEQRNRQLLLRCMPKVQAQLMEQSRGTIWQPITKRHVEWLEIVKSCGNYTRFDEAAYLQQLRDQLRYTMLIKEAEEAERMLAELE